jgi:hypothetical protein
MSSFFDQLPNAKNIRPARPIDPVRPAAAPTARASPLPEGAASSRVAWVLVATGGVVLVLVTAVVLTAGAVWHFASSRPVLVRPAEARAIQQVWYVVADKTAAGNSGEVIPLSVNLRVLANAGSPVHEVLPFGARARVALAQPADTQWIAVLAPSDGATVFVRRGLISLVEAGERESP